MSDWSDLKQRCADNNANLILRVETIDGDVRLSLAAIDKGEEGKRVYDARTSAGDNAPQFVITSMVDHALESWWPDA